jgi:hypothetical protein
MPDSGSADAPYTWSVRVRGAGDQTASVYARNHAFRVGAPASFRPRDAHPSAVELLLGALGADLTNGFQAQAARAGITVDALELALSGHLGNALVYLGVVGETGSPAISHIRGTLYVSADADDALVQAAWRTTLARSPLYNTLNAAVALTVELQILP